LSLPEQIECDEQRTVDLDHSPGRDHAAGPDKPITTDSAALMASRLTIITGR